jgi:signal transduction histidine kinase
MLAVQTFPTSTPAPALDSDGLDLAIELAHDVRSPLGAIIALTDLLQSGACGALTELQARQIRLMRQAAEGVSKLTNDVVDFGRIGALEAREPIGLFEVNAVLASVRDVVQPMAETSGLDLDVRNEGPGRWFGRRAAVTRVLLNLAVNAIKYTDSGRVDIVARSTGDGRIEFSVQDTGAGFDIHTARRMKGQASGSGRSLTPSTSTGLGLAICQRLLRSMGSRLVVTSRIGVGSRLSFSLAQPART